MEITSYLLGKKAGGGETPTGTINITENGITNVSSYASADVNVQPNLQSKEVSITSNGSSTISPDSNYDGLSSVSLTTNVQPNLETKSITITENTTTTLTPTSGKDGMSSVSITTDVSGGGGLDWSAIGYSEAPDIITDGYNYAKQIYDNWDLTQTDCYRKYYRDKNLVFFPEVNTSNVTDMSEMFRSCSSLIYAPDLDCSRVSGNGSMFQNCSNLVSVEMSSIGNNAYYMFGYCTNLKDVAVINASRVRATSSFEGMFQSCASLTYDSIDNIMQMCITASAYTGTKTLYKLGITGDYYSATTIRGLPHYEDFINAGWTIGFN